MKSTGILRRIDELGRIVIPKEIRKNLKIKDGESLEIFINDDSVILKKYSFMSDLSEIAQNFADSFYDSLKENIIITDTNKVIAASSNYKKKYVGKDISMYLSNIISKRSNNIDNNSNGIEIINGLVESGNSYISNVLVNGDSVGAVLVISDNRISSNIEKNCIFISKFLSRHLQ